MTTLSIEQIRPELTWNLRNKILYPDSAYEDMAMEEDDHGIHFGGFLNNRLIAVVSLFQKGTDFQFRKFAVDESLQRQGIGRQVLDYITMFSEQEGGTRLWCNARISACGFYDKNGFQHTGEFFSRGGYDYEILEKPLTPRSGQ